ncbi:MAG: YdcH family protein [Methylocella sp.]
MWVRSPKWLKIDRVERRSGFANRKSCGTLLNLCGPDKEFCMSRETHLAALGQRHDALDKEIAKELLYPAKDELKLAEMKRRKLQLKDEIAKLQCERPLPSMQ